MSNVSEVSRLLADLGSAEQRGAARSAGNPASDAWSVSCQRESDGSWSAWIDVDESIIRGNWASSTERADFFKRAVINFGLSLRRTKPHGFRLSIRDIADSPEQQDIAARRLEAFRVLFVENREPEKFAPASSTVSARPPAGAEPEARTVADGMRATANAPPAAAGKGPPESLPDLFTDDELEERIRATVKRNAGAGDIDHLAVIRHSYPRIASAIKLTWGNLECENYMNKLILNDRRTREGFPPPVLSSLLALYRRHTQQFKFPSALDVWAQGGRRDGPV